MKAQELESILPEVVRRLVEALRPERVYLFGSQVRGQAGAASDIDLLVVVPRSDEPGHLRDRAAYRAIWGIRAPIEIQVWTRDEFQRGLRVPTSLSASVERTGRLLYAG